MSNPKQNTQKQAAPPAQEQAKKTLPTEITARAYPVAGDGPVLANLTLDVNGCFAIRGAKLVQGKNGAFVSMPQRQTKEGYQEVAFPTTKELHEQINNAAVSAYQLAMSEMAQKLEKTQQAAPTTQQTAPTGQVMSM